MCNFPPQDGVPVRDNDDFDDDEIDDELDALGAMPTLGFNLAAKSKSRSVSRVGPKRSVSRVSKKVFEGIQE